MRTLAHFVLLSGATMGVFDEGIAACCPDDLDVLHSVRHGKSQIVAP